MPTAFEMRQKNEKFANNVRAGKTAVQPSTRDRLQKKSPIGYTALAVLIFVLAGAGVLQLLNMFFK
ncbi:hypothetical protein M408DRAFT_218133 [Serendipita vermifera MAFF 305830]|uniref:Stress-associated endoplasmic reticulum protein n=1 Tax=Serendipita vermifera MAFF 305830 TaxID=933852 RepID=A0A0C2X2A4_SERVB|nr:hypothetical protein M408DRAFT_218133 [Serendipita vermifera MAFF 305830]